MNHLLSVIINGLLCIAAIEVQVVTRTILHQVTDLRWQIAGSQERCPSAKESGCTVTVSARSFGHWTPCDADHPPSGANLPMSRWFKVTGHCPVAAGLFTFQVPMPEQMILR
jgi:hypothetical protein